MSKEFIKAAKTLKTKYGIDCGVIAHEGSQTDEEWLANRKTGIGGSDIPQIIGTSPWGSALTLWAEKLRGMQVKETTEQMEMGNKIEGFIAEEFKSRKPELEVINMRYVLEKVVDGVPCRANLDRLVKIGDEWGIGEIKNVIEYSGDKWEDDVPVYYKDQGQWYMGVTGLKFVVFIALLGGRQLKAHIVRRNQTRIDELQAAGKEFWECYTTGKKPEVASPLDIGVIGEEIKAKEAHPEILDVDDNPELGVLIDRYDDIKAQEKELKKRKDITKVKLLEKLNAADAHKVERAGKKILGMTITKGRASLDKKTFESEAPDAFSVYESYMKIGKPSIMLK